MALTDNLISYWKMDEASGGAADAHGSNTLTDNNTVGSASGKINGARDLEATNSEYFSRADNTDLSTGDIDFTISFWVNPESISASMDIMAKGSGGAEYLIQLHSSGVIRFWIDNFNALAASTPTLSTGNWYHVVCWHDSVANQFGVAINAGTPDTTSYSGGLPDSTGNFQIGVRQSGSEYFDGLIDEVGFWKRVLTSDERTELYNGGAGLSYDDFDGGGATFVPFPRPRAMRAGIMTLCGGM